MAASPISISGSVPYFQKSYALNGVRYLFNPYSGGEIMDRREFITLQALWQLAWQEPIR